MSNRELFCLALKVLACGPERIWFTSTSSGRDFSPDGHTNESLCWW
jgi:hypothetical protein